MTKSNKIYLLSLIPVAIPFLTAVPTLPGVALLASSAFLVGYSIYVGWKEKTVKVTFFLLALVVLIWDFYQLIPPVIFTFKVLSQNPEVWPTPLFSF